MYDNNFFKSKQILIAQAAKAVKLGDALSLENLLKEGLDPNTIIDKNGTTLVCSAAQNNQAAIIQLLAKYKADLNQPIKNGMTPVYMAATKNFSDVIQVLANNGANLNVQVQGFTPAFIASQCRNLNALEILVKNGADINLANAQGMTPAHMAALQGYTDVMELLVEYGANLKIKDKVDNSTPVSLALQEEKFNIINLLFLMSRDFQLQISASDKKLVKQYGEENIGKNMYFHNVIYQAGEKLNYKINYKGYCTGYTLGWVESKLANDEEQIFNQHRCNILVIIDVPKEKINERMNQIRQKKGNKLMDNEQSLINLHAFFDRIILYQDPIDYPEFFGNKLVHQSKTETISSFASSQPIESKGGLCVASSIILNFDVHKVENFWDNLQHTLNTIPQGSGPIACVFGYLNHTIGFTYNDKKKTWDNFLNINTNAGFSIPINPPKSDLNHHIVNAFDFLKNNAPFQIQFIVPKNYSSLLLLKDELDKFKVKQLDLLAEENIETLTVQDKYGCTLAWLAAVNGDIQLLKVLAQKGIDLNVPNKQKENYTLAHIAAQNGHEECISILAEYKAKLNEKDKDGCTPIWIASCWGQSTVLNKLVELGANIDEPDNHGCTPAEIAAHKGNVETLRLLAENGADLNKTDKDGYSAAFLAAQNGNIEILTILAEYNADLAQPDLRGHTPLSIAIKKGHHNVVEFLNSKDLDKGVSLKST